ncbi:MAG TPA: 50S ribosomal protein L1 [Phycisphaerales bacterium]|nr:50S ribosomal protein L1 [Phycisphaerales bacterium]
MSRRKGKRSRENETLRSNEPTPMGEVIAKLRRFKAPKFDQTVNVVAHLGIDPKQADQALRGSISMPHGIGKSATVVAFCPAEKVDEAKAAGAIEAGGEELVEKIAGGWMEFDVAVATPDMMRVVSRLGQVLGPKGLMPSPKAGTVTPAVADAVRDYSAGKQEYRNDEGGNIHCVLGKMSFSDDQLLDNLKHFHDTLEKIRPSATKGAYLKKMVVSGTMTPGVHVAI